MSERIHAFGENGELSDGARLALDAYWLAKGGGGGTSVTRLRESVATSGDLPADGNEAGDARITEDTGHFWVWDGTVWVDAGPAAQGPAGQDATVTDANVAAALSDNSRAVVEPWIDARTADKADTADLDAVAARPVVPATEARAWGHSYMAGVGPGISDATTQGMAALIAKGLGLPLNNRAVGGTVLHSRIADPSHWGNIVQDERRGKNFLPVGGFFPVMWGLNDINHLPLDYELQAPYRAALRTVITRFRAASVFENDDDTVVLGGAGFWDLSVLGSGDSVGRSGANVAFNPAVGATIEITTPADFPGGTIALGFVSWPSGGATVSGTVNGQTYSINTALNASSVTATASVLRIPDVPAGTATYTFTVTAVVGAIGCMFDYWSWEPPEHLCPIVAVVGQPYPLDYDGYGAGGPYGPPSDAKVDALNQGQQDVVGEFGDRVLFVDTHGISKDPAYWVVGNVHPNPAGHAWIADEVVKAVRSAASFTGIDLTKAGGGGGSAVLAPEWESWTPVLSGAGTSLGNGAFQTSGYVRDGDTVSFYTRLLRGSTTVFGTWVELNLPVQPLGQSTVVDLRALVIDADGWPRQDVIPRLTGAAPNIYLRFYTQTGPMNDTAPIEWDTNDAIDISGTYRA